jgi:hypothetical protein
MPKRFSAHIGRLFVAVGVRNKQASDGFVVLHERTSLNLVHGARRR